MTEEAANSILKFLEEPKGKTIIILITEAEGALLPTIISRCQIVKFLPVPIDIIKKELYNLIKNKQKSEQLAYFCGGKPGLAISFTNNPELIQNQAKIINQLENLVQSRLSERINFVLKVGKNRNHILELLDVWLSCFRDLLLVSESKRVQTTFQFLKNKPLELSVEYPKDKLLNLIRNIYKTKLLISKNVNLKLALENLVINF